MSSAAPSDVEVVVNLEDTLALGLGVVDTGDNQCEVCCFFRPQEDFIRFSNCGHRFCISCVRIAFQSGVMESRVNLQCLNCSQPVQQSEIQEVLDARTYDKYLSFTLRQYLMTQQPNVCFCLAPNCPYACIKSVPDSSPAAAGGEMDQERDHFMCRRDECQSEHCNKCKRAWHPGRTCEEFAAEAQDAPEGLTEEMRRSMDVKNCPTCQAIIQKQADGCNQVICAMCKTSFCWLCGKPVTEMHFMSPTGCSLYGTQRWSRRKRWCCRLSLWLTAPLLALLLSIVVVPVVLIVLPLGVGYKVHKVAERWGCYTGIKVVSIVVVVSLCVLLSPLVALLASVLTFPLTLLYVYCFIPIHVCLQS